MTTIEERLPTVIEIVREALFWVGDVGHSIDPQNLIDELADRGLAVVERKLIGGLLHLLDAVTIGKVGEQQFVQFEANGYHGSLDTAVQGVSGRIVTKRLQAWDAKRKEAIDKARETLAR